MLVMAPYRKVKGAGTVQPRARRDAEGRKCAAACEGSVELLTNEICHLMPHDRHVADVKCISDWVFQLQA
jgi:hypothetical protein